MQKMKQQTYAVETTKISRRFKNIIAVDQLNLNVPIESVYGFLGPNGAGKSTTIRMLLGLIRPNSGQITLFDQPLNWKLLGQIGALVESPSLYPHLTGRENLEITCRLTGLDEKEIDRVLAIVRMEKAATRLVKGYSLGMRQRLGLALAMLNHPRLLILDEPTNGLDPAGIHEIRDIIKSMPTQYGMTVLLSSHLLGEIEQVADHIGIINQGKLLFEGRLHDLQAQRNIHLHLKTSNPLAANQFLKDQDWQTRLDDNSNLIVLIETEDEIAAINRSLIENGINVFQSQLQQPDLENIFLQLTNSETLPTNAL
jgi:ABC-2 type transport system ATP-binding protein